MLDVHMLTFTTIIVSTMYNTQHKNILNGTSCPIIPLSKTKVPLNQITMLNYLIKIHYV